MTPHVLNTCRSADIQLRQTRFLTFTRRSSHSDLAAVLSFPPGWTAATVYLPAVSNTLSTDCTKFTMQLHDLYAKTKTKAKTKQTTTTKLQKKK